MNQGTFYLPANRKISKRIQLPPALNILWTRINLPDIDEELGDFLIALSEISARYSLAVPKCVPSKYITKGGVELSLDEKIHRSQLLLYGLQKVAERNRDPWVMKPKGLSTSGTFDRLFFAHVTALNFLTSRTPLNEFLEEVNEKAEFRDKDYVMYKQQKQVFKHKMGKYKYKTCVGHLWDDL